MVTRSAPDYYELLRIPPNAGDSQIKRAYRRAAVRWHPDVNPSPEAGEMMKHVNEARRVLLDPFLRREYDRTSEVFQTWKKNEAERAKDRPTPRSRTRTRRNYGRNEGRGAFSAVATAIWLVAMAYLIFLAASNWDWPEPEPRTNVTRSAGTGTEQFFQSSPATTGNNGIIQSTGQLGHTGWNQPNDPFQTNGQFQSSNPYSGSTIGQTGFSGFGGGSSSGSSGFGGGGSFSGSGFAGSFP